MFGDHRWPVLLVQGAYPEVHANGIGTLHTEGRETKPALLLPRPPEAFRLGGGRREYGAG